ncbi:2,3,4,5-tetrahydropyridine-2,6-dicarboxylate N-succinyltransferase [Candidatus Vidania fulgoroideorum]
MILEKKIKKNWKNKKKLKKYLREVFRLLENGKIRISEKKNGIWKTNFWIKKSIIEYIKNKKCIYTNNSFDKFEYIFSKFSKNKIKDMKIRISKGSIIREGSYIGKNTVIMPSFINVGAYIGENTMIDTWSTIGSCAQIGKNVHISGGVGIGGVLEPLQGKPVIIENNCFIGARSEIVEGVIIKKNSVISMGVYIGQSTKIYDRQKKCFLKRGLIPKNSVVVPGSINYGKYSLYSAIIVKKSDKKTKLKTKINVNLRK